jgi:hypothetical protein
MLGSKPKAAESKNDLRRRLIALVDDCVGSLGYIETENLIERQLDNLRQSRACGVTGNFRPQPAPEPGAIEKLVDLIRGT